LQNRFTADFKSADYAEGQYNEKKLIKIFRLFSTNIRLKQPDFEKKTECKKKPNFINKLLITICAGPPKIEKYFLNINP